MIRWIFLVLFLANVIYFGWEFNQQLGMDRRNAGHAVAEPVGVQRLKLLSEDTSGQHPLRETAVMEPGQSGAAGDTPADSQLVAELPDFSLTGAASGDQETACFTFGPIPEQPLAVGLQDWFNSRRVRTGIRFTDQEGRLLFWIYLAPESSRSGAMATIEELRNRGVSDFRLISKGNLENAISLGLFSSQATVNERLQELQRKGYQPVVVPYTDGKRVYWLDVQLPDDPEILNKVFNGYPARYSFVPVECGKIVITPGNP